MSRCVPCEQKRQRLKAKLDATKERARQWAKDNALKEVAIFMPYDEDGEDERYSFAQTAPTDATCVEYLSLLP
jgi:hypothetical protein